MVDFVGGPFNDLDIKICYSEGVRDILSSMTVYNVMGLMMLVGNEHVVVDH
jgi:hypothetical protein